LNLKRFETEISIDTSEDDNDSEDAWEEVKDFKNGKEVMMVSSGSDSEEMDYGDASIDEDEEDVKALAETLRDYPPSRGKGKGKVVSKARGKELGESLVKQLKVKTKAKKETKKFAVVITSSSSRSREKGKAKAVIPDSEEDDEDDSDDEEFAPPKESVSDSADEEDVEMLVLDDTEEEDGEFDEEEELVKLKKLSKQARARKAKDEASKIPARQGAVITGKQRAAMKKMSQVRLVFVALILLFSKKRLTQQCVESV
jgi:hypothetical protein